MGAAQGVSNQFYFPELLPALEDNVTQDYHAAMMRGLTHKANNFLAVIQGFSTLILMQEDLDPTVKENVEHVKEAGQGCSRLYERALLAGGCGAVSPQELQLADFLKIAESDFAAICEEHGVSFRLNMEPTVPALIGDAAHFKGILVELITNAAEAAGPAGGEMAVDILAPGQATREEDHRVDLFIRNTGSELSAEQMESAFKPFFTTKESDHFGIGLNIASVLANQMKMRLGAQSGEGTTTFWLSAPAA